METDTAVLTSTEVIPTAISPEASSEAEQALTTAISELWSVHVQAQSIVRKTKEELKIVRDNLASRLYEMKLLLARPGRAGQWTSFLSERGIPRTSADRLVIAHEKSIGQDGNGTDGAIKELTNEEIDQAAKSVWARVGKKLGTHQAKYRFFSKLIIESGAPFEEFDDGVLLLLPVLVQEATAAATAPAGDVQ
jgi:hypothetical protein